MNDNDNSRVCINDTIVKECFSIVDVMPSIMKLLRNDTPKANDNDIYNHVKSISKIRDVCTPSYEGLFQWIVAKAEYKMRMIFVV